jgi:arginine/lysine/ornithine decarboxylase
MTQLIFKNDLEKNKLEALLHFLKTWDIDAELKTSTPKVKKTQNEFSLSSGIWKDYDMDAKELREKAWSR